MTASDPSDGPAPPTTPIRSYQPMSVQVAAGLNMDPRLQRLLALRSGGETTPATASSLPGEIPVIALVSDLHAWEQMSEVRAPCYIGGTAAEAVVTGRIPIGRVAFVRRLPFVKSLKAARPLSLALDASVRETRAHPVDLGEGLKSRGGQSSVIGIIDYGCDFQHDNFRDETGRTRIEAIWEQGGKIRPDSPLGYGRLYERAEIDAALNQPDPYTILGYGPARDTATSQGTHGTHVLDIAAGNGKGSLLPGFAPEASIIFVDVSSDDIAWSGPEVVGVSFGDSVRLVEAARFIFDRAGERPCVINISLGTNGGPHDGTTLVERGLDELVKQGPNRAIVLSAGNACTDDIHASGTVAQGSSIDLEWHRPPSAGGQDEMEIWYAGTDALDVEVFMPDGTSLGVVRPGENGEARDENSRVMALVSSRESDPTNGANMIGIYLRDGLPTGRWLVRLHGQAIGMGAFHAWIERDDISQSKFLSHVDEACTIGSISCGRETMVVASYDAHKATGPLSYFSGAGPTRDSRQKPDIAAPGHSVLAAHSRTRKDVTVKSGTSMAAPAVAGALALILAEAAARGLTLSAQDVRTLITKTARRNSSTPGWDPRWGMGRLDVAAALEALEEAPAVVATLETAEPLPTSARNDVKTAKKPRRCRK